MERYLILAFYLFSNLIFSQGAGLDRNWSIKGNAIQLIDGASFPTFQLSTERKINSYFSIAAEFGYQIYSFDTAADTIFSKPSGFKSNIEGRIYLQKLLNSRVNSKRGEFFVGLQLFYRQNQFSSYVSYREISQNENSNSRRYNDDFGVKTEAMGINLTFGNQISVTRKLLLEPFIILGYMNREIRNSELQYVESKHEIDSGGFLVTDLENQSGKIFNFGFGFRIGYRL